MTTGPQQVEDRIDIQVPIASTRPPQRRQQRRDPFRRSVALADTASGWFRSNVAAPSLFGNKEAAHELVGSSVMTFAPPAG
jgi:hypothetical protein